MNKHLLFLALVCLIPSLRAQIVITNATFPVAGDTLKTVTDDSPPAGVVITSPGGPQTWDFSQLDGTFTQEDVYRNASEGAGFANFPGATLYTDNQVTETYYTNDAGAFSVLGFNGQVPAGGFPIEAIIKYNPPFIERRAPLQFFDIHSDATGLLIPFAIADLPSEIVDSLGFLSGLADSIRIRIAINQLSAVDAFGTLAIPGGTYEVLRQKVTSYQEVRFDVHSFLGWLDVTDQIAQAGIPGFGVDTTVSHLFLSNDAKEPIAVVVGTSNGQNIQSVTYKNNGVTSSTGDPVYPTNMTLTIAPNPVGTETTVSWHALNHDVYTLTVYDINGRLMHQEKTNNNTSILLTNGWTAGIYSCVISDQQGNVICLSKMIKD